MHSFTGIQRTQRAVYGGKRGAKSVRKAPIVVIEDSESESNEDKRKQAQMWSNDISQKQIAKKKPLSESSDNSNGKSTIYASRKQPAKASDPTRQESDEDVIKSPHRKHRISRVPLIIPSSPSSSSDLASGDEEAVEELLGRFDSSVRIRYHEPRLSGKSEASSLTDDEGMMLLLETCNQENPLSFSSVLDQIESKWNKTSWSKLGEATYSEVFTLRGSHKVVKVIPLQSIQEGNDTSFDSTETSLPEQSLPQNVRREIKLTRALSKTSASYVTLFE